MGNCLTCQRHTNITSTYDNSSTQPTSPNHTNLRKSFRRQLSNLNIFAKSSDHRGDGTANNNERSTTRSRSSEHSRSGSRSRASFSLNLTKKSRSRSSSHQTKPKGKNKPLLRNLHKSTTKGQIENTWSKQILHHKRLEFWDTAPSYDGREEIWLALKAAVENISDPPHNYDLAQVIIDSACISLPYGTFDCCYDELGTMYQIPGWVVATPGSILEEERVGRNGTETDTEADNNTKFTRFDKFRSSLKSALNLPKNGQNGQNSPNDQAKDTKSSITAPSIASPNKNAPQTYKFRLMNYSAMILDKTLENIDNEMTVLECKQLLLDELMAEKEENSSKEQELKQENESKTESNENENDKIEPADQKPSETVHDMTWFCAGKILRNNMKMGECGIAEGFMVSVQLRK